MPEKRREVTTEGGLDVVKYSTQLQKMIKKLHEKKILVSLFIDANEAQIAESARLKADIVEIHTGEFCRIYDEWQNAKLKFSTTNKISTSAKNLSIEKALKKQFEQEFLKIKNSIKLADSMGLECHAGHGLNYATAKKIATIAQIKELNIGHFIIGEAVFEGLKMVLEKMKKIIK